MSKSSMEERCSATSGSGSKAKALGVKIQRNPAASGGLKGKLPAGRVRELAQPSKTCKGTLLTNAACLLVCPWVARSITSTLSCEHSPEGLQQDDYVQQMDQFRTYQTSSRTRSSSVTWFLPFTCQKPVMPGRAATIVEDLRQCVPSPGAGKARPTRLIRP